MLSESQAKQAFAIIREFLEEECKVDADTKGFTWRGVERFFVQYWTKGTYGAPWKLHHEDIKEIRPNRPEERPGEPYVRVTSFEGQEINARVTWLLNMRIARVLSGPAV